MKVHIKSGNNTVFQRNNENKKRNIFTSKDIAMRMNEPENMCLINIKDRKGGKTNKIYIYKIQN